MNVRGILLDLDNTLYCYNLAHDLALKKTFDEIIVKFNIDREFVFKAFNKAKIRTKTMLPISAAGHDRLLYFQNMFEILKINPLLFSYEASEIYWNHFFKNMLLTEDSLIFLKKTQKIPICLVTDLTASIQFRKIKRLKLDDRITSIVTSEEVGVEKPHPFPFLYGIKKLGCRLDEVIMIGDSLENDILGATSLGIKSFLINRNSHQDDKIKKNGSEHYTVNLLTEIEIDRL
ncbi:HAD family hydrolase (plasmid) [Candidatus Photodesmus blepharus]|uniref:HAD family hydrolase n=2 Tax=Candidatus Photodesmus blepharonis TaxID=1179155 RepID=A0A084CNX0_9GAMM|nr:HAD family hydrolase [Candidatus Photodesmus blepharus]